MANKMKQFVRNPGNVAFTYYRYSSDAQRDVSIDQQKQAIREYAEKNGIVIPTEGEFEDRAITGTTIERPGLQRMLFEAKHKRPAFLIVWKLDRLSREVHDSFFIDAQLRDIGVQIITVGEVLPEDEGLRYAIQGLYASMAHNFIVNHRSNVMRGLNYNAENALYNGRKVLGYVGKPEQKYEIDPKTAPIVKKIFEDYVMGKPLQTIANELNESGFKTVKGNKFGVNSLANILHNRAYIGEYKWGKHIIKGGMPRIISDELFIEAEKVLTKNRRGGTASARKLEKADVDFWLTSHIYCGECGAPLHGISGTSKNGTVHYYYTCLNHKKHNCSLKNQTKDKLETIVKYVLERILEDRAIREMIAEMCFDYYEESKGSDNGAYLASLKQNYSLVEKKLNNFVKAISEGIFNETTQQAMKDLENQKQLLQEQISAEEQREKYDIKLETIIKYFDAFVGSIEDEEVKKRVLDIFVDKIYIYKDKMIITLHFLDDKQELSYEDTIEMIDNHSYLMDCVNDPEGHTVWSKGLFSMVDSIRGSGGETTDFFQ